MFEAPVFARPSKAARRSRIGLVRRGDRSWSVTWGIACALGTSEPSCATRWAWYDSLDDDEHMQLYYLLFAAYIEHLVVDGEREEAGRLKDKLINVMWGRNSTDNLKARARNLYEQGEEHCHAK